MVSGPMITSKSATWGCQLHQRFGQRSPALLLVDSVATQPSPSPLAGVAAQPFPSYHWIGVAATRMLGCPSSLEVAVSLLLAEPMAAKNRSRGNSQVDLGR